jgi:hypothetical protein
VPPGAPGGRSGGTVPAFPATADGSRQVPVTTTGGSSDVSQADDGTIIALSGVRLHKLDRAGKVLADFETPVSTNGPTGAFYGGPRATASRS